MPWELIEVWAVRLGFLSAALIGLGVVWNKGIFPMLKFVRATVRAADALEETLPILREVAADFRPNDGRSLGDTVRRMDRNIATNFKNVATIYRAVTGLGPEPSTLGALEPLEETPALKDSD